MMGVLYYPFALPCALLTTPFFLGPLRPEVGTEQKTGQRQEAHVPGYVLNSCMPVLDARALA